MEGDENDERLERLLGATADVGPRGDFAARVIEAAMREPIASGFWAELPRVARFAVPIAAAAAIATVAWAFVSARALDEASLASQAPEQSLVASITTGESE